MTPFDHLQIKKQNTSAVEISCTLELPYIVVLFFYVCETIILEKFTQSTLTKMEPWICRNIEYLFYDGL